jgi:tRNA-Thr(GGU) m(6)t(6)A37 methyltransferase TsaA
VTEDPIELRPIGWVESQLRDVELAPLQGDEGAPDAWLVLDAGVADGLRGLVAGQELVILTWLHLAARDVLVVHPRGDHTREERGVFATRSPSRPNPIGLHRVTVLDIAGTRLRVAPLEAVDGTPILDLKPARPGSPDD